MARSNKRKRELVANPVDRSQIEETPDSTATATPVAYDASPFHVEWVKEGIPAKRAKTTKKQDVSEPREEEGIPGAGLKGEYTITPGSHWNSLRKYRNFVVNPNNEPKDDEKHKFEVGQFVFVNHSEVPEQIIRNDKESWVAQVKEVRAEGQHAVYVRVMWLYWPEELPLGRQVYHGERELVASNYHQIIDAMTVSGKAQVYHLVDAHDLSSIPPDALYWRQTIDIRKPVKSQVSVLPRQCVCKTVSNPDQFEVRCPNEKCGEWQHEDCLEDAVLTRYWEERQSKLATDRVNGHEHGNSVRQNADDESEMGDTIVATPRNKLSSFAENIGRIVVSTLTGNSKSSSAETPGISRRKVPARKSNKKGRRNTKSIDNEKPWEGKLAAELQVSKNSDGQKDFNGKATIYRISDQDGKPIREDFDEIEVVCLFCGLSMVEDEPIDENLDPGLFVSQQPKTSSVNKLTGSKKQEYDAVREAAAENAVSGDELSPNGRGAVGVARVAKKSIFGGGDSDRGRESVWDKIQGFENDSD